MDRRTMLGTVGVSTLTALGGCLGSLTGGDDTTGMLATHISDNPGDIEDFDSCVVTVTSIDVMPADAANDEDADEAEDVETTADAETTEDPAATEDDGDADGDADDESLETIEVDDAEVDLTEVQNDESQLVSETELGTGEYAWLRVNLTSEIDATLTDGADADVKVPSGGLKLNKAFEIRADETTNFTADFTPVKRGQAASYIIQPVTQEVTVTYGTTAEDSDGTTDATTTEDSDGTTNVTTAGDPDGTTNGTTNESAVTDPALD